VNAYLNMRSFFNVYFVTMVFTNEDKVVIKFKRKRRKGKGSSE